MGNERTIAIQELPDVLTVQEAADILRIGRNTAYEAIRRGELPSIKMCGRILVARAAIETMLRDGQRQYAKV